MKLELGKMLFPKLPYDLRRRRMATLYLTALVCAGLGVAVYLIMFKLNHPGK